MYFNQGDCFVIRPIDNEDTLEIIDRLRMVTLGCEVSNWCCPGSNYMSTYSKTRLGRANCPPNILVFIEKYELDHKVSMVNT